MRKLSALTIMTLGFVITNCGKSRAGDDDVGKTKETISGSTYSSSGDDLRFDRVDAKGRLVIPVCWDEPTDQPSPDAALFNERSRGQLEHIIRSEYERPPLNFILPGWAMCSPQDSESIHILPNYSGKDNTDCNGDCMKNLLGKKGGVTIDFARQDSTQRVEEGVYVTTANNALHEFNHVLGFYHDHVRIDRTEQISEEADDYFGVGDYDSDSISNYLSTRRDNKNGVLSKLSSGDIRALLALYHRALTSDGRAAYTLAQPQVLNSDLQDARVKPDQRGQYQISFKVPRTPYYRFKFGPLGDVDCKSESGYSKVLTGGSVTHVDVTEEPKFGAGSIFKICIIGGVRAPFDSDWQDLNAASQLLFRK